MSRDTFSNEEAYGLCLKYDFNREEIEKFCGIYKVDTDLLLSLGREYAFDNIYTCVIDMPLKQLELFFNSTFARTIDKYKVFIKDRLYNNLINDDSRKIVLSIKNELAKIFDESNYDREIISKKLNTWNLDVDSNIDMIIRYILSMDRRIARTNIDYYKNIFKNLTDKTIELSPSLYEKIIRANSLDEVVNLVNNSIQNFDLDRIHDFCIRYHVDDYDKAESNLREKHKMYAEYKRNNNTKLEDYRREAEIIFNEKSNEYINDYINSEFRNIKDYCEDRKISVSQFRRCLNRVKEINSSLYKKYIDKCEAIRLEEFNNNFSIALQVLDCIENGILDNGNYREFDLIDYFLITKLDKREMLKVIKEGLTCREAKVFGAFLSKNPELQLLNENNINKILTDKMVFGMRFDDNGVAIPGTGREITYEEKTNIINYINDNDIPFYEGVYRTAIKRLLNGIDLNIKNK